MSIKHQSRAGALLLCASLCAAPLAAIFSNGPTPAYGQPQAWWGELQPADTAQLPAARDKSDFIDGQQVWAHADMFRDLHIEGSYIFVAGNAGFEIWDRTNPGAPTRASSIRSVNFPISSGYGHAGFICTRDVACPPGNSNIAVVAMDQAAGGVVILNTTNKANPVVVYQDTMTSPGTGQSKTATAVYCATINGVQYAFAAVNAASNGANGINVYNLGAAAQIAGTLTECAPNPASPYPNVWVYAGMKPTSGWVPVSVHGAGNFVVTGGIGGWELFNVSNPAAPVRLGGDTSATGHEATMWQDNGKFYVAVLRGPRGGSNPSSAAKELHIYDVTAIATGSATAPGAPLAIFSLAPYSVNAATEGRISFSRTGSGTPMLHFSGDAKSSLLSGTQTYDKLASVMDVTDPSNPREVTPVSPGTVTWWGWIHQYGWVRSQTGYFAGNYLYRASFGVMDIYEWNASQANHPPVVTSTPPTTAIVGQSYSYAIAATDPEGDTITYTLTQAPNGMTLTGSAIAWVPGSADVGSHMVKVSVSDGQTATIHEWTISVTAGGGGPGNQPPSVNSTPVTTAIAGVAYSYPISATDPEGDTLAYVKAFGPANIVVNGATGMVTWVPDSADVGSHSVVVNVTDGVNTVPHAWSVTVAPASSGPPPGSGGTGIGGTSRGGGGGGCAAQAAGVQLAGLMLLMLALPRRRRARQE